MPISKNAYRLAAFAMLSALVGCAGTSSRQPTPLAPPQVAAQVRNFLGTPLSGPTAGDIPSAAASDAVAIEVAFFALQTMPQTIGQPLGRHVRLIIASRDGAPVLPSQRLTLGVRIIELDRADTVLSDLTAGKFGPSARIAVQEGVLLPGATASFSIAEPPGDPDLNPDQLDGRRLELDFDRPRSPSSFEAAIQIDDFLASAAPPEIEEAYASRRPTPYGGRNYIAGQRPSMPPAAPPTFQSELALFDCPASPCAFALLAPIRFGDSQSQAVLALVRISAGSRDQAHQALGAQALAEIEQSSQAAARQADLIGADPPDWPGLKSAVESLAFSSRQRAGLVFLAQQTDAGITEDIALCADDTILSGLAGAVQSAIDAAPEARDRNSVGWLLERTSYELLLQSQSAGKLPPELASILAVRAGQAGRDSGTLEEVINNADGQQDMRNRLAAENYIFLEDSSPAARARAFDWLTARHLAPVGYDPLAPPKQRRAALESAECTTP